jgi:hypothetical protein
MVAVSVLLRTLEVQLVNAAALWASIEVVILVNGQPDGVVGLSRVAWCKERKKREYASEKQCSVDGMVYLTIKMNNWKKKIW